MERLLDKAAVDPATRPEFIQALLNSEVYALGTVWPPPVDNIVQAGSSLRVVEWSDDEGSLVPFFTSEAMLRANLRAHPGTDPRFVRLPCRAFLETTKGSRVVLNPHGRHAKVFVPDEVERLLTGSEPGLTRRVLQAPERVRVGVPAHVPVQLPTTLSRYFALRPVVHAAHLGWIAYPDGHRGYLIVVVADDREAAMSGFGSVQIGQFTDGNTFDVMVVPPNGERHLLSQIPPFYVRPPRRGLFRKT